MSCPFYGFSMTKIQGDFMLMPTQGNQCALITSAHSPCIYDLSPGGAIWGRCEKFNTIAFLAGAKVHLETGTISFPEHCKGKI